MSNNISYYDEVFSSDNAYKIIKKLPLTHNDGVQTELNINDILTSRFFKLGTQLFSQDLIADNKAARYVMGDIKDESGIPTGFSVGMALLCVYAANYHSSTRSELLQNIEYFLTDGGKELKIKELSEESYLDILRLQMTLKLPTGSLTRFIGNAEELSMKNLESGLMDFKSQKNIIHVRPTNDGSLGISQKLIEKLDPRQMDLFNENKNGIIEQRQNQVHNIDINAALDIHVEQHKNTINTNNVDILSQALAEFQQKFLKPKEESTNNDVIEIENPEMNNKIAIMEYYRDAKPESIRHQIQDISDSNKLITIIAANGDLFAENNNKQYLLNIALCADKLKTHSPDIDFHQFKSSLLDSTQDYKDTVEAIFIALDAKHSKKVLTLDDLLKNPEVSYLNVFLENNRSNLLALDTIPSDNHKLAVFYHQYANNGALEQYLKSNLAKKDHLQAFNSSINTSGKTSLNHLSEIGCAIGNQEVMEVVIDKMFDKNNPEIRQLLSVMVSTNPTLVDGVFYPANEVFKDMFIEQMIDISVNNENHKGMDLQDIIVTAVQHANSYEERAVLGDIMRNLQSMANDGYFPQSYVDNTFQGLAEKLSANMLAQLFNEDELENYGIELDRYQKQEFQRTKQKIG